MQYDPGQGISDANHLLARDYMRRISGSLTKYSRATDLKWNILFTKEARWNSIYFLNCSILYDFNHASIGAGNVSASKSSSEDLLYKLYFRKLGFCFMWKTLFLGYNVISISPCRLIRNERYRWSSFCSMCVVRHPLRKFNTWNLTHTNAVSAYPETTENENRTSLFSA